MTDQEKLQIQQSETQMLSPSEILDAQVAALAVDAALEGTGNASIQLRDESGEFRVEFPRIAIKLLGRALHELANGRDVAVLPVKRRARVQRDSNAMRGRP